MAGRRPDDRDALVYPTGTSVLAHTTTVSHGKAISLSHTYCHAGSHANFHVPDRD